MNTDLPPMNMNGSFILMDSENDGEAQFDFQNLPKDEGWLYETGTGPAIDKKVYSFVNTSYQCFKGLITPSYPYEPSPDPFTKKMQARVANPGSQLGGYDIYQFISGIEKEHKLNHISYFYFPYSINNYTFEEIKDKIDELSINFNPDLPIVIPINFEAYGFLERNHIESIIIKDRVVDYYDSKGALSEFKVLKCSSTLQDVLNYCREKFNCTAIAENSYIHQYDTHNCGVFVCRHIYSKICENQLMGTVTVKGPLTYEIQNFRETINQIAYTS